MGSYRLELTMQIFVLLATLAAVFAAPAPQDEDIPAAIPYVHEDIVAEPYVHEEPTAPVAVAAPVVSYAAFPYATHAYTIPVAAAPVATKTVPTAPVAYAYAAPYGYAYTVPHTGCVNSVGSVVPCAV